MFNNEKLCVVIVTYNAGAGIVDCVKGIAEQAEYIIIVDNYSNSDTLGILSDLELLEKVEVVYNDDNYGIAKAVNIGARKAIECGFKWIMTLDQDSIASPGMLQEMSGVYERLENKHTVGIICPRLYDMNKKEFLLTEVDNNAYKELKVAIQSGSIMNVGIFLEFGFFNELLFIYYVDVEFSMRLKRENLRFIQCNGAVLYHEEGKKIMKRFLSRVVYYDNYSEMAVYYISRNSIYMIKNFSENKKSYYKRLIKDFGNIFFFDDKPYRKLKYYFFGILDGLSNKYGKCSRIKKETLR